MAENEYSVFWSTGTSADGADAYTSEKTRTIWRASFSNGVWKDYLNSLAVTTTGANNITVATGAANIQGFQYFNTGDAVSKTVSTPSTGATGLRVVVRLDWVGTAESAVTPPLYDATTQYTARVLVIKNADGTAAIPDATTTDGSAYDLTLATGTIAQTTGIITLTDARTYATSRLNPRTRSFIVSPFSMIQGTGLNQATIAIVHKDFFNRGWTRTNTVADSLFGAWGQFIVPSDYLSGLTVEALVDNMSFQADIYAQASCFYSAVGESGLASTTHTESSAAAAVTLAQGKLSAINSMTLASATVGDVVYITWTRDESNALDTGGNANIYFVGFRVTYTALL